MTLFFADCVHFVTSVIQQQARLGDRTKAVVAARSAERRARVERAMERKPPEAGQSRVNFAHISVEEYGRTRTGGTRVPPAGSWFRRGGLLPL